LSIIIPAPLSNLYRCSFPLSDTLECHEGPTICPDFLAAACSWTAPAARLRVYRCAALVEFSCTIEAPSDAGLGEKDQLERSEPLDLPPCRAGFQPSAGTLLRRGLRFRHRGSAVRGCPGRAVAFGGCGGPDAILRVRVVLACEPVRSPPFDKIERISSDRPFNPAS
jgi:hypothetical protein